MRQAGMSLVEILAVLAIIAVMSGVTMMSISAAGRGAAPETEARRLASRIGLALDEALVTGHDTTLVWDESGYEFQASPPDLQRPEPIDAGMRHELSGQLRLEASIPDPKIRIAAQGDGPTVIFLFIEQDTVWRVEMNGLTATAAAGRAS